MPTTAAVIILLLAVQVIVSPPGSANVTATVSDGYPIVHAVLASCPTMVLADINGISMGGVPFNARPLEGGGCNVTVDLRGLATFTLHPGDNLTLTYRLGEENVTVSIVLEAASSTTPGEGVEGVDERVYVETVSAVGVGGDNTPKQPGGRDAWLAASIMLAAAALIVGAREYGSGRGG